jgi:hypothetical protein
MLKNQLAVCTEGECQLPCSTDSDCATSVVPSGAQQNSNQSASLATRGFEACEMGKCVFVGCENNAECRSLFGLENQRSNVTAVCR